MEANSNGSEPKARIGIYRSLRLWILLAGLMILVVIATIDIPELMLPHSLRRVWDVLCLLLVAAITLFSKQLIGYCKSVQISSHILEQKIRARYQSEAAQLTDLGFSPLFFFGEAYPLIRLLLVYPALVFMLMWLNGEVTTVQNGTGLLFGFQIFISRDGITYAHANRLGMTFHTAFQDRTILMTKNYGGASGYGPTVVVQRIKNAGIGKLWTEHQNRIKELEADGKHIDRQASFQAYSEISRVA